MFYPKFTFNKKKANSNPFRTFPNPMFMPNVVGAAYSMNPSQMGAPDWMGFGGGSMDS
jgi:hypothetical protein